ncbi:amyloid-beta A4 precursor protein-binding family A member 2 isoform X3 [Dunckerocampus dactyliophorus]|uniref:amyloid-beta A4 precursor protein-binding family A member 2 isoform X3 n=1 Tax=Dunckerocampus dactyliophorus TaxID=161453 RepID=UPI0024067206|nr:amyloid-beta A4 precursor protein-binding family A member 2 isoform X3 [Dunckerocampus dactyliophorus]
MACKPPNMAQRKRPGTSGVNSMAPPVPTSCPAPLRPESRDLKALPARQRPTRYSKESQAPKPLPRTCKAQYSSRKCEDVVRSCPEEDTDADVELKRYSNQPDAELEDQRPPTPSTPELEPEQEDHNQVDIHDGADSLDDDSSSDYINNTSEDEEDYDDGLAEEDEGVTYYIRYCPEDDSYMEGMDCSSQGDCNHGHSQEERVAIMQQNEGHTECQEAVEGWTEDGEGEVREEEWVEDKEEESATREEWREEEEGETEEWREGDEEGGEEWTEEGPGRQEQWTGSERHSVEEWAEGEGEVRCEVVEQDPDEHIYNGRPEPILDHNHHNHHHHQPTMQDALHTQRDDEEEQEDAESEEYCPNEEAYEEEDEDERHGRAYTGDYYVPEDNGNSVRGSPFRGRKVMVVEGETGEEAEEDIDQIVAEIKMSMSMGSLSSGTDQSPEELVQDPPTGDYPHAKPDTAYLPAHHRHDSRPKSLNLPSVHHNNPDLQRNLKIQPHSPEDRQRWQQEQVSNGAEQPRKQQRSDLNIPLENNNVPDTGKKVASFPSFVDVPGPCEPEDLIDGIIFAANYLGSTQLLSERNPSKNIRMMQAQEAVSRVKRVQKAAKIKKKASPDGDAQTLTEVDLFISTQRIKVLNADSQETMMDNALRTISYIADIGNIVVLMARRRMPRTASQDCIETTPGAPEAKKQYKMICHVFESEDAQLIAQSIGQAFSVAYQEFLRANGINPEDLSQKEYSDIINTQEMYNDDLIHFSNSENCKEICSLMRGGIAERGGVRVGHRIIEINGQSVVATAHEKIVQALSNSVGEIHMKTMPAAMFRLLTGQETPMYI